MQIKDVDKIRAALEEANPKLERIAVALEIIALKDCCDRLIAALTKIADAIDPPVTGITPVHEPQP